MAGSISSGMTAVVAWRQLEKTGETQRARWEKQPSIQREIEYVKAFAARVKDVDQLLNDRRFMNFALSAFQLESEIDKKGLLRKVLLSNLGDNNSYANRMNDPRFVELTQRLDLKNSGVNNIKSEAVVNSLVVRYLKNEFDKAQGNATPGLREAIYFKENAGTVKSQWDVLGNKILREVVTKAFDIPREFAVQGVEAQATALARKVDVAKLKDPKFVDRVIQTYLTKVDQETSQSSGLGANMYAGLLTPLMDSGNGVLDLLQGLGSRR